MSSETIQAHLKAGAPHYSGAAKFYESRSCLTKNPVF